MNAVVDAGSFRDPAGRVFSLDGRVLRTVTAHSAGAYERMRDQGLLDRLVAGGLLVAAEEVEPPAELPATGEPVYVLEHPRVPFISYPYEWGFSLLKKAALHHLDVHLEALARGFTLSDATAYNVQFVGTKPVFIDHLSFRPYRDGELWAGHRQFCMQFLNPLLFWSRLGIAPNPWYRGSLEGIAPEELAPLLSLRNSLSWTVLAHVKVQAALQRRSLKRKAGGPVREQRLTLTGLKGMLLGLRSHIAKLRPKTGATVWGDYASDNSYEAPEAAAKRRFVAEMVAATRPNMLFDLGCNSGDYSAAALEAGAASVIGFDFDHGALEQAFRRFDAAGAQFLPLWLDAANPSPSQGWAQAERKGLADRASADAVVALAFIHHIAIGRNVPLPMALDWLVGMAPVGIIEFPPKGDPMVQTLLAQRQDIFPDYDETNFMALLGDRARIVRSEHLSRGGRVMVWYDRT